MTSRARRWDERSSCPVFSRVSVERISFDRFRDAPSRPFAERRSDAVRGDTHGRVFTNTSVVGPSYQCASRSSFLHTRVTSRPSADRGLPPRVHPPPVPSSTIAQPRRSSSATPTRNRATPRSASVSPTGQAEQRELTRCRSARARSARGAAPRAEGRVGVRDDHRRTVRASAAASR